MDRLSAGCIGALLLYCAATGVCQSVSGSVSAEESAGSPSSVNASVSGVSAAQISGMASSGTGGHSVGTMAGLHSEVVPAAQTGRAAVIAARTGNLTMSAHAALVSDQMRISRSEASKIPVSSLRIAREPANSTKIGAGSPHSAMAAPEFASETEHSDTDGSSADFPDSTRGTGIVNAADPGTKSPMDWAPGLTFGFADLDEVTFLNPSLHELTGRRVGLRSARARILTRHNEGQGQASTGTEADPLESLRRDILGEGLSSGSEPNSPGLGNGDPLLHTALDDPIRQQ